MVSEERIRELEDFTGCMSGKSSQNARSSGSVDLFGVRDGKLAVFETSFDEMDQIALAYFGFDAMDRTYIDTVAEAAKRCVARLEAFRNMDMQAYVEGQEKLHRALCNPAIMEEIRRFASRPGPRTGTRHGRFSTRTATASRCRTFAIRAIAGSWARKWPI